MRKTFYFALALVCFVGSVPLFALEPLEPTPAHVLISEIQTASNESASEEFVELYNPLDTKVDVTDWRLEYRSAAGDSWTSKATLAGEIEPRSFYLVSSSGYLTD